jgi:putative transposase
MDNQSLSHTKYNCTYHVVFIPKYRRKTIYGSLRTDVRDILKKVCDIEGIQLIEGAVCADHVHIYMAIPPKMSISTAMSKLKGKSALMIFDKYPRYRDKNGRHFWARGYYVETIGQVNEETIKNYIKEQEDGDRIEG